VSREALRLGLVGAGAISQSYVMALRGSDTARITAIADQRPQVAKALAEDIGCAAYESHEQLASKADVEGVIVCTPPNTHPDICQTFFTRGVAVLCEKPMSIGARDAVRMIESAAAAGVVFTMASKFRYVDDVIRAKSLIASGVLGEIVLFENAFTSRVDMSRRWNADPAVAGGGVLIDNGTHSVDIVRYFLGPIEAVSAVEGKRIQGLAVEDTVRLFVRTTSGVLGSIDLSWSLNKDLESYIDIYGSNGTIRVGWKESKYRPLSSQDWIVFGKGYDKVQAFRRQVENFCRAVRGEERLLIGPDDALASVQVIEAAYESTRRDDWVPVGAVEDRPRTLETAAARA
jgi:predicted dehydrogenase